jgi:hypothetical protein
MPFCEGSYRNGAGIGAHPIALAIFESHIRIRNTLQSVWWIRIRRIRKLLALSDPDPYQKMSRIHKIKAFLRRLLRERSRDASPPYRAGHIQESYPYPKHCLQSVWWILIRRIRKFLALSDTDPCQNVTIPQHYLHSVLWIRIRMIRNFFGPIRISIKMSQDCKQQMPFFCEGSYGNGARMGAHPIALAIFESHIRIRNTVCNQRGGSGSVGSVSYWPFWIRIRTKKCHGSTR